MQDAETPELIEDEALPEAESDAEAPDTGEEQESDEAADAPDTEGPPGDDDELVITLGEEQPEPEPEETPVIRQMRQALKEAKRREREKDAILQQLQARPAAPEPQDPGPIPKIADFDFDDDKHAAAVSEWTAKKAAAELAKAQRQRQQQEQQEAWNKRVQAYEQAKTALKVPRFDDAEEAVKDTLTIAQQSLILKAKEPEKLIYALGNNPKRLKALAAITDPVDFVYAVGELRQEMRVIPKKKPPVPERVPARGGAGGYTTADNSLEKLRAEAEKTGDYSRVLAYKRDMKAKK
jgi:FMN phosphatase YigB (HAD superfamily)